MAARLKPELPEIARLRAVVADQHRRLELVRGEISAGDATDVVADDLSPRCAKPRLRPAALTRLMEQARARLELAATNVGVAYARAWPERQPAVPVLRPTPGLPAYHLRGATALPNLVVALFARSAAEIPEAVARVLAEQQGDEPFLPVFLTNHPDFGPLRAHRLAFEYFPFVLDDEAPPPEPRWAAYFVATLELTMRRWGVRQVVLL